jgi:hypothetical protein
LVDIGVFSFQTVRMGVKPYCRLCGIEKSMGDLKLGVYH